MKRVKINGVSHSMEQKLSTKPAGWERFSWHLMRHKNDSKKQPMALLNHCWKAAKALVFPVYCPCCRQPCDGADNRFLLCNPCKISLLRYRVPSCPRCGLFSTQVLFSKKRSAMLPTVQAVSSKNYGSMPLWHWAPIVVSFEKLSYDQSVAARSPSHWH